MQPGDLIFFSYEETGGFRNIGHVGMYVGKGMFVDARGTTAVSNGAQVIFPEVAVGIFTDDRIFHFPNPYIAWSW